MTRKKPAKKSEIYLDNRVQLFLGKILKGELEYLYPVLDEKMGYRYPSAETFVDKPEMAEAFLKSLQENNILKAETCGVLLCCPDCGYCNVEKVLHKLEEHISEDTLSESWKCRKCGKLLKTDALSAKPVYFYKIHSHAIDEISDRLIIKPLLEFIHERGYNTESPGFLTGKSEVLHVFDILAKAEDHGGVIIALDFIVSEEPIGEEKVISMFAKVFDTNPPRSIFVAFPELTNNAKKLAKQYDIDFIETRDLSSLWKDLRQVIPPVEDFKFETLDVMTLLSLPDHLRKTASVVCEKGNTTADEISETTKRARAVESSYLNQLVRMGYLKKERKGRKVLFSVIS